MKNNKILFIVIGVLILLLATIFIIYFTQDKDKEPTENLSNKTEDKIVAPASNTEELLKEMETIEIKNVTADEIVFSSNIELKEKEKVAVWIYSEPKFLGYFEVIVENGIKKIAGLKEALEKITIEDGAHNIAITKESGEAIGYIDVQIKNDGTLTEKEQTKEESKEEKEEQEENKKEEETEKEEPKEEEKTTTKKVTKTESIKYTTTKQNEVNMKKGTTSVVQAGSNGTKEITYEVTYDSNGKELKRKKISEKVTKEAVNEIIKVGVSDFNLSTDYVTGGLIGFMCTEADTLTNPDGGKACDDTKPLKNFSSISINDVEYLVEVDKVVITPIKLKLYQGLTYTGTYQGVTYYFDARGGGGGQELITIEECNKYGFTCGTW